MEPMKKQWSKLRVWNLTMHLLFPILWVVLAILSLQRWNFDGASLLFLIFSAIWISLLISDRKPAGKRSAEVKA